MQQNELCPESLQYEGRDAFVIRVPESVDRFPVQNTRREFPYLVDQRRSLTKRKPRVVEAREKLTYVLVLRMAAESDLQPPPLQLRMQNMEAEQLGLLEAEIREGKRQKQRDKRQTRRRERRACPVSSAV
jgi:hypothetical protein